MGTHSLIQWNKDSSKCKGKLRIPYPKYHWKQDLRKKISPGTRLKIRAYRLLGFTWRDIATHFGIPEATARYQVNTQKERERIQRSYYKRKANGTLKRKPQERIRKSVARKRALCPDFKAWEKAYRKKYEKENPEKLATLRKQWHKQHPHYFRDYMRQRAKNDNA